MEQPGNTKTAPKSGAQRNREYVARQKAKDLVAFNKKHREQQARHRLKKEQEAVANAGLNAVQMLLDNDATHCKELCKAGAESRKLAASVIQKAIGVSPDAPPAVEYRPDDEDAGLTDTEQEGDTDTRINASWKHGTSIQLPLTKDYRKYSFNMDEDVVLSTYALKLCHEAIEEYIPAVERKEDLGGVLNQLKGALEPTLLSDLWYIYNGRVGVQHSKWSFELEEPHKYEAVMKRVIHRLCPNWKLKHHNAGARRLERKIAELEGEIAELEDENAELEDENAYLRRQQLRKRGRVYEDDDHDEVGIDGRSAKRAREDY